MSFDAEHGGASEPLTSQTDGHVDTVTEGRLYSEYC